MHKATPKFWVCFNGLPEPVRTLAKKNFELLQENPQHPSLHFKKIGKIWSVRIGLNYRALAILKDNTYYWHWIGTHTEYDAMV